MRTRAGAPRVSLLVLSLIGAASFWSTAAVEILSAVLIATSFFHVVQARGFSPVRVRSLRPVMILWCCYVLAVGFSILLSPYQGSFAMLWHALLLPAVCALPEVKKELGMISTAFVVSGTVAAVTGLVTFVSGNTLSLASPFVGDTTFVCLLMLAGIASLAGIRSNLLSMVAVVCIVFAVHWSALRSPIVALVAGGTLVLIGTRMIIPWLAVNAAAFLLGPTVLHQKFGALMTGQPADRYTLWRRGLELLGGLPFFGYGPGSFMYLRSRHLEGQFRNAPPLSWHNDLLQTLLESGWIAGIAYGALLGILLWKSVRPLQAKQQSTVCIIPILFLMFFFLTLTNSVVSTAVLGVCWWILLGILCHFIARDESNEHEKHNYSESYPG